MTTIKSYTDLKQSKVLAKILLSESADMCYLPTHIGDEHHFIASLSPYLVCTKMIDVSIEYCTPCWSLAALLDVLPQKLIYDATEYTLEIYKNPDKSYEVGYFYKIWAHVASNNKELVDACVVMIEKLHELNLL